ncbi:hypothetical protein DFQ27_002721 [Actinomortierella ambigua]|uniref:Uncharacterized protein n=1 Tax=Actinomortierella ambigua TaxID=1343610 RepID=A0A9P6QA63_9FUNG|nr:hypothetical protein DFQ27_002721 [Actinomortierella ambigua]
MRNHTWQQPQPHSTSTTTTSSSHHNHQPLLQKSLILDPSVASKVNLVENLVDTAALIIESIWPTPTSNYGAKPPVIPLHIFVKETLRRSRTTLSTLQLALYYIYRIRTQVLAAQEKIRQDQIQQIQQQMTGLHHGQPPSPNDSLDGLSDTEFAKRDYFHTRPLPVSPPHSNNTPASLSPLSLSSTVPSTPVVSKSEPIGCGRRMFLAALILASKFQQDRTYSNKAWSKISGLPVAEINQNEITFLTLIDYRLYVSQAVFQKWVMILTEKGKLRERVAAAQAAQLHSNYHLHQYQQSQHQHQQHEQQQRAASCSPPSSPLAANAAVSKYAPSVHQHQRYVRRNSINVAGTIYNTTPAPSSHQQQQLPPRMSCITASSLEQTTDASLAQPNGPAAPSLPSFALFIGGHCPTLDYTSPSQKPALATPELMVTGLVQSDKAPRQQQGMGSYLTTRWVQAQRREYLRTQALAAANAAAAANATQQWSNGQRSSAMWCTPALTASPAVDCVSSMPMTSNVAVPSVYRSNSKLLELSNDFLPSPVSAASPMGLQPSIGSKRRSSDLEDAQESDRDFKSQRRLSVSFLVDC